MRILYYSKEIDNTIYHIEVYSSEDLDTVRECGFLNLKVQLFNKAVYIGWFNIGTIPGNSSIGIIYNKYLGQKYRGSEVSKWFREMTSTIAKDVQLTSIMCTVVDDNIAGHKNAVKSGYEKVKDLNGVSVYIKNLRSSIKEFM